MKPKRLPRLWCALQGLLPLEPMRQRAKLTPGLPARVEVAADGPADPDIVPTAVNRRNVPRRR